MNIDWLEIYALEPSDRYPMNADYFRSKGYWVTEREYGTRHYSQMFTIQDNNGQPWIEVRREPQSGSSSFSGFVRESCRLRLVNWACYQDDCVSKLRDFMALHDYIFKRIARIDVCYDFCVFDSGDRPDRFARRYFERKFSKINQCKVASYANDGWATFDWESISWGSRTSMVGTKLYNKTKELKDGGEKKPYIRQAWFESGLLDNPLDSREVWRVEFSMKSNIEGWLEIEDVSGKRVKKRKVEHRLELFDSRDKLWQRFQDLAFHYFHFRYVERVTKVNSLYKVATEDYWKYDDRPLKRKDLCRDKVLFHFDKNRTVYQIVSPSPVSNPEKLVDRLYRELEDLHNSTADMKVREAIQIIMEFLRRKQLIRFTPNRRLAELEQLIIAIRSRIDVPLDNAKAIAEEAISLLKQQEIW